MNVKRLIKKARYAPSALCELLKARSKSGECCPYCKTAPVLFSKRGHFSKVLLCPSCRLLYGWPKQDSEFNQKFYQKAYSQAQECFTTQVPTPSTLPDLVSKRFAPIDKNIDWVIEFFKATVPSGKLLDYGCSWGYSLSQFEQAGYDCTGLEVCRERSGYGREHLGLKVYDNSDELVSQPLQFDIIYSSHVLEHLPDPGLALRLFQQVASPGCLLMVRVPNCGGDNATKQGVRWGPFSSRIHPMSYRAEFFEKNLPAHGFDLRLIASEPYDPIHYVDAFNGLKEVGHGGDDLIIVAEKNASF